MKNRSALLALCEGNPPVSSSDAITAYTIWHTHANTYHKLNIYVQRWLRPKILTDINTLRPRQNGRHFADDIFKCIFLNENVWIPIKISLKFVAQGPINNIPALVQIMAWRRPGDKPLSGPMPVSLLTHICVTRPQWFKISPDGPWVTQEITHVRLHDIVMNNLCEGKYNRVRL